MANRLCSEAVQDLLTGRPLERLAYLAKDVVGHRHTFKGGASFEAAMEFHRNVPNLHHRS
jgi:hypothetical protein